ncbi:MAG: ABC transporter ATP-binding protein [Lachnospiraceae bacterium]|nr:ABC transporter ATP-binding protein [Lachnospiraceae bacterium]
MGTVIYQAVDITAGYGKKIVLKNLSLDLEQGSCTFIVGANGSGKSTLFSVLTGIKKMRSGQLLIDGKIAEARQLQKQIGYVPQDNPLFAELTVKDNLLLWYGGKEALQKELTGGVIEKLGLNEVLKKRVSTLSGGMQKRVSIGCAMAGNPRILIMDEPGAALDPECKEILYAYLADYRKAGGTVLMSSHEKADLEMGDMVYLLSEGRLKERNTI